MEETLRVFKSTKIPFLRKIAYTNRHNEKVILTIVQPLCVILTTAKSMFINHPMHFKVLVYKFAKLK